MENFKIGDIVYNPGKRCSKYNEENDYLFVITRYIDANQIMIGSVDMKSYEVISEYIVSCKDIKKYTGNSHKDLLDKLIKHGYFLKNDDAYEFIHCNDSDDGYLPILGINNIVAHKK